MILELFRWWYGSGILKVSRNITNWPTSVERNFSVPLLLRNLFAPWRRIINYGGRSVNAQLKAAIDNLVSRLVGFVSRIFVLLAAWIAMGLSFLAAVVVIAIWPLLPVSIIYLLVRSITR